MELIKTSIVGISFKQYINPDKLKDLLSATNVDTSDIKILEYFRDNMDNDNFISYRLEEPKHGWGRLVCKTPNLFRLSRRVRHYIGVDNYYDFDIKNAQPSVVLSYCKKNGIECAMLQEYVEKRDKIFKMLENQLELNNNDIKKMNELDKENRCYIIKDVLKKIPISIMNGGGFHSIFEKLNKYPDKKMLEFFQDLTNEIETMYKNLILREKSLYRFCEKYVSSKKCNNKNLKGSFLSFFYQELEKRLIDSACHGFILEENSIFCYELDGFKLEKNFGNIDKVIEGIQNSIIEDFGEEYNCVKFCVKPMDEAIVLEQMNDDEKSFLEMFNTLQKKAECDQVSARLFHDKHKDMFLYNTSVGWMKCDTKTNIWIEIPNIIDDISMFFDKIAQKFSDRVDEKKRKGFLSKLGSCSFAKNIHTLVESKFLKDNSFMTRFESKKNYFVFSDGKGIDLNKNNFDYISITATDYVVNHCGYPSVDFEKVDETLAKDFVENIQESEDNCKSLLSYLSSSLYGENKQNGFIILKGTGGNGKSILDSILRYSFGGYYKTIPVSEITTYDKEKGRANAELFKCKYARYVSSSEPENSKVDSIKVSTIKKLTGNECISVRTLHKEPIDFVPHFTLFLNCNDMPNISNCDDGVRRRLHVVDFPYRFKDKSKVDDDDKYQKEADFELSSKIEQLNFRYSMVKVLLKSYYENKGKYKLIDSVKKETCEYMIHNSPLKKWFNIHYEQTDKDWISTKDLYDNYSSYEKEPMPMKKFSIEMENLATKKKRSIMGYLVSKKEIVNCLIEKSL